MTTEYKKAKTIAIDGPAAAGKSSVGLALAQRLAYLFFDTGVMYRAITLLALEQGISMEDEDALGILAETTTIDVQPPTGYNDGRYYTVLVDSRDSTWALRTPEVDANVSYVAAHPRVRLALTAQQRRIGQRGRVVMVGRDIGTVVMPDADVKFYLDASLEERARRRYNELVARGQSTDYEAILADLRERDRLDSTRAMAPLRRAADAIYVDTTGLSRDEVVEYLLDLLQAREEVSSS